MFHSRSLTPTRRHFLAASSMSIGSVALAWLLHEERLLADQPARPELEPPKFDLTPKPPHAPARAKAMISLFMQGGPSHIDLLDPKPVLTKFDGTKYEGELHYDMAAQASATLLGSPWKFAKRGQCGTEVSELLPHLGEVVDDLCVIRSMQSGVNNHGASIQAWNTGKNQTGRPVLGSWLTYGLGSESRTLPAYLVLADPGGVPVQGIENWTSGRLPSLYQGTIVRAQEPRILNLDPPPALQGAPQQGYLDYLARRNRAHLERHPGESELEARIAGFELAAAMQTAAKEALDIGKETEATRKLYGIDDPATRDFGTRCLIARRLVERGVRFVQLYTKSQFWDHHNSLRTALPEACRSVDKPVAGLLRDLKSRGLLETTLVQWGGEMGRLPVIQSNPLPERIGRDHNTFGFSMWLAGGGIKGGSTYGATDDFGYRAVQDVVTPSDYHATVLHLFGLDHRKLVYRHNNQELSLIDNQPCRVLRDILA
jgi:hypothetical protein